MSDLTDGRFSGLVAEIKADIAEVRAAVESKVAELADDVRERVGELGQAIDEKLDELAEAFSPRPDNTLPGDLPPLPPDPTQLPADEPQ